MSPYVPCPQCRRPDPQKVGFTWWGGMLGPRMLSHVKCQSCGTAYNGKTGQSNTTGIVIYSVVLFVIGIAIVVVITLAR
jgi:transposase-like protein